MSPSKYIVFIFSLLLLFLSSGSALADTETIPEEDLIKSEATLAIGYQTFSLRDEPGRAAEYKSFETSPTLDLTFFNESEEGYYFSGDVNFLNDEEYDVEVNLSKSSQFRLSLRTERFFHNLDHIPYDNGSTGPGDNREAGTPVEGSRPDSEFSGSMRAYYTDYNPNQEYGQRTDSSEIKLRTKLPTYPAHLNLSYWRLEKNGHRQLRFAGENCTGCHMQSSTRKLDRVTEEIKGGVDAHLGYIDLSIEAVHREFRNKEDIPENNFGEHRRADGAYEPDDQYQHDEDPDSEMTELTLRANTSPSGGLVGSASFTIGERENNSDITSVGPIKAETDYYKTTADVTYTPSQFWTVNLRYRLFDIDNDNSDFINTYAGKDPNLEVREALDYERAWYEAVVNYRPSGKLTLKAELRYEEIDRSNTGPAEAHHSDTDATPPDKVHIDPYWELPSKEAITRAKIGFYSRLLEKSALKVSGWAMLRHDDDPAYGTSYEDSRELFLSANYAPSPFWGLTASLDILDEDNNGQTVIQLFDDDGDALTPDLKIPYDIDRERQQQNFSTGAWVIPADGLSFDMNYGYLHTEISQDLLFGAETNPDNPLRDYTIEDNDVDYEQTVHTLSAGVTWQILDTLSCRMEGYHIRSEASYDPDFATTPLEFLVGANAVLGTASSSELRAISKVDIQQNGLKGRVNWQIDQNLSCRFETTYDDYDDGNSNVFDGSVVSYMASITRSW